MFDENTENKLTAHSKLHFSVLLEIISKYSTLFKK